MKKPLKTLAYCALGIVIAGLPLIFFNVRSDPAREVNPAAAEEIRVMAPILVRYTNAPAEIRILRTGDEILRLQPNCSGQWYGALPLPPIHPGSVLELEVQARWAHPPTARQVITLQLFPPGLPTATDTQWTDTPANELHSIFLFRW